MIKYRKDKVGLSNSKKNFFYVINFFRIFDNKKIMYFLIKEKQRIEYFDRREKKNEV